MISVNKKTVQYKKFPEEVAETVELVKVIASLLGYDDSWRFSVSFIKVGGDLANISVSPEYRIASIKLDLYAIKAEEDPNALRKTLIHELLHIPLWGITELMSQIATLVDEPALEEALRVADETAVTFLEHAPLWDMVLPRKGLKT